MESLFLNMMNISITATWLVLAVLVVRLIFRKAPKWTFCLLWGLVALRLVMPFSIESALSLVPSRETVPQEILQGENVQIQSGVVIVDSVVNPIITDTFKPVVGASVNPTQVATFVASVIWLSGMAAMLLYFGISYLVLHLRLRTSVPMEKRIRQSERVQSPFVLGLFRPVIYLPFGMDEDTVKIVLAHEKAHIKRCDHVWKPLGFLLLSVYWFNPILWVAYILLCRDIEAACDEKVLHEMGLEYRKDYSVALLNCSVRRSSIMACPVAFGETNVKRRITNVMNYKKPAFWLIVLSVVVLIVVAVCFLTNKPGKKNQDDTTTPSITPEVTVTPGIMEDGAGFVPNKGEYYFVKGSTTINISGKDYDLRQRNQEINGIMSVTPAGNNLVIECHVSPNVSVYCIYNMAESCFEKDIISSTQLIWHSNDISTAVYMYGNEVRSYNGTILTQLHLGKDESHISLRYDDKKTKVIITIGDDEKETIREETLDWLMLITVSSARFDIDGDGVMEVCTIKPGPTSGIMTWVITAYADGIVKYMNTYATYAKMAFAESNGVVKIKQNNKLYNIHAESGAIVIDDLDVSIWGGADWNYNLMD